MGKLNTHKNVAALRRQFNCTLLEQSEIFEKPNGRHLYKVSWYIDDGYTVLRRLKPVDYIVNNYAFWARQSAVESWIQLDGGQWYTSAAARPVIRFETLEQVLLVIEQDYVNQLASD